MADVDNLPIGTLVRVTKSMPGPDTSILSKHGALWLVTGTSAPLYFCKALATGYEHVWFPYEVEIGD